jgi:K+-sensing histidine kinase KdpD
LLDLETDVAGARLVRLRNVTASIEEQRIMWAFHGQLSHKLKTPLALLDGFMNFLAEDLNQLSAEERDYFVSKSRASAGQLRDQIMSIFNYLDSHDVARLKPGQCTLAEIPAIFSNLAQSYGSASVEQVNKIDKEGGVPLSAQAIELIGRELLQNAQKFHPQQSPNLKITLNSTADKLRVQMTDDGQTLSANQLARLWFPYYQAERGFSGQMPGMGLGLSTVASFVWNVGGTCRAHNRTGGPGIVIELLLPLVAPGEQNGTD